MADDLARRIDGVLERVTQWRHDLHAHPQTNYEETYASELVRRELAAMGVDFAGPLAETGVVGWILPQDPAAAQRDAVALRADMDALPLAEETHRPWASQHEGFMHACGHDGHTAMLLGAAAVLAGLRDRLPRPVKLLFQPAEEGGAGARALIEAGALSADVGGCAVGAVFGQHGSPLIDLGHVGVREGPDHARVDTLQVTLRGHGGHGARPHESRDPVLAAAHVITALQSVVSRNVDPVDAAVVSVCSVHAGRTSNVIPASAELVGTIRTYEDATAALVHGRIRAVCEGVAGSLGCEADVRITEVYPVNVNDAAAVERARQAAGFLGDGGVVESPRTMGAEDFAFYGRQVPSCFVVLGLRPPGGTWPNLHSPQFDFNDAALPFGIRLHCELALAGWAGEGA